MVRLSFYAQKLRTPNLPGTCAIRRPMKPNETHKLWLIRIRVAMLAYAMRYSIFPRARTESPSESATRSVTRYLVPLLGSPSWFLLSSVMSCWKSLMTSNMSSCTSRSALSHWTSRQEGNIQNADAKVAAAPSKLWEDNVEHTLPRSKIFHW